MSDRKIIKFGQDNLNFAKFKLQIIKFLTKFSLQLDKIWFKTPTQTLKFTNSQGHINCKRPCINLVDIKMRFFEK